MLQHEVQHGATTIHDLPDDNPAYLAWSFANYRDAPFHSLISLYALADALQVRGLKDPIISLLVEVDGYISDHSKGSRIPFWNHELEKPAWIPDITTSINIAWQKLPQASPLRKVLILLFCDNVTSAKALRKEDEVHNSFLASCLDIMLKRWIDDRNPTPWGKKGVVCKFHEHDVECFHRLKSLKERVLVEDEQLRSA